MKEQIEKLTSKELEILLILWNYGTATVKTINEEQNKIDDVGYTTTLKIMQLMYDKGILSREPKGKGHVYSSTIPEDEIQNFLLKKYTKTTSGKSAMKLVLQALGNQQAPEGDLLEIKNYLNNL
jgi:predicted transcriptional regulator